MLNSPLQISPKGPLFSRFIAGFWRLKYWGMNSQEILSFTEQLLELGVTSMDHAKVYQSEALFGEALSLKPSLRQKMQIVSKCGIRPPGRGIHGAEKVPHYDSGKKTIIESTESSLSDLKTDYLDLLLIHRADYLMDGDEIAEAFSNLHKDGKVRHFGVSNFTTSQFAMLQSKLPFELVTNQIEFSPYNMSALENGQFDQCQQFSISPMIWSCLGGGRLFTESDEMTVRLKTVLGEMAEELNVASIDQLIYAWILALPCKAFPVVGSSKIERIKSAVGALDIHMTREQWYTIWQAVTGYSVP
ncbi:MAG: aldo/keto reductase [Lentisphaeraceae bacterium]|nr:aldo/keto reductase [Lentisphaeraceae bacterium]